ncbi:DUF4190 domain-containing protein [Kitasatospora sp. NPDC058965]|uniref:DUF4190 domain-containing protein n=1 Tax=Kitasatospora sp. NPDC058965 TaxID=3346682 RepID=UPI00367738FA
MTDEGRPQDGAAAGGPQDAVPGNPWAPPAAPPPPPPGAPYPPAGGPYPPPGGPYAAPGSPYPYAPPPPYPYGQAGYPYPPAGLPPYGYPDPRPWVEGTNGLAITSLVTGILCCLWPAAIGFGIAALVQLRNRRQKGRGLAVAGLVLGCLGLVASLGRLANLHDSPSYDGEPQPAHTYSAPALPPLPTASPRSGLTPSQQTLVDDLARLDTVDELLAKPLDGPDTASWKADWTAQVLADTIEQLKKRQWSSATQGAAATTLIDSLEADHTVWRAAAGAHTVAAYQDALRTNAPVTAENVARAAFGLTPDNHPLGTTGPTPGADGSAPSGTV